MAFNIDNFAGYNHGKVLYAMLDGHTAYCMNYGLAASGGQLMNSFENSSTSMKTAQEYYMKYVLYFGFSTTDVSAPSNDQADKYIATQALVWIVANNIFGTSSADSAASKLCATAPNPSASYSYYESVRNNVTASYNAEIPSFSASKESGAETYELKWSETNQRFERTFTDSNGVLSQYDFSIEGYSVEKSGNSMTVYSSSVNTNATTGKFTSNDGKISITGSCVFWLTGNAADQTTGITATDKEPSGSNF